MRIITQWTPLFIHIALFIGGVTSLKHHLVLTNDHRVYFSVSSFGYLVNGRLDVIVQNLTLSPDPSESEDNPQFGFVLIKSDQTKNPFLIDPGENHRVSCMLNVPRTYFNHDLITLTLHPNEGKVRVECTGDDKLPSISSLHSFNHAGNTSHGSYIHTYEKRSAILSSGSQNSSINPDYKSSIMIAPEMKRVQQPNRNLHSCQNSHDLKLTTHNFMDQRSYSFNFSMHVKNKEEEGLYYLTFHNCLGRQGPPRYARPNINTPTMFNLSMLIYETNYPNNYLSAGLMPLPQMYFVLSVMFFLSGCIWINFVKSQKENVLKIHYLMTVLVFAKSSSLLFHGINYHYIALDGQPVVTWAYLYYATRSVKGALFFITLALIGSGWSFIKHILSDKDKKIIMVIVALQVIAHVAEIVLDESTEGEASNEFWAELCSMVDLFSCVAILYPITWSVRHLEEASRTDGKAAINLKKLELFKRFYIISTIYIYITRIVTFIFLSMLSYRYSWLAELVSEMSTLVYFIITGNYFQPMPTNPYLLLSSDNDLDEDILFSVDAHDMNAHQLDELNNSDQDRDNLLDENGKKKVTRTRRLVEEIV